MALSDGATAAGVAGLLVAASCWLAMPRAPRRKSAMRRISVALGHVGVGDARPSRGLFVAVLAGVGMLATVALGPVAGLAAGSLAALAFSRVQAQRRAALSRRFRDHHDISVEAADVSGVRWPAALDLLAACLCAGATLEHALRAVAEAFPGAIAQLLSHAARLTALGAAPEDAWQPLLADPICAPVARAVIRAHHSGAALTDVLSRVADERRRALRAAAETAAAKAAVRSVLPLGACFLPAFVLVGVVPVVAGFIGALRG